MTEARGGGMSNFGACAICGKCIESEPVVVADDVTKFAHGQCWVDSGREVIGPEEIRLMLGAAALPAIPLDDTRINHVRDAGKGESMKVVRDEIHTDNAAYAAMLERLLREHGQVPHNGYMWRVTHVDSRDFTRTEWLGPLVANEITPVVIPGSTAWVFLLERDA